MKKLAIDWDESELRYVLGQMKNASLAKVITAGVVKRGTGDDPADVQTLLRKLKTDLDIRKCGDARCHRTWQSRTERSSTPSGS